MSVNHHLHALRQSLVGIYKDTVDHCLISKFPVKNATKYDFKDLEFEKKCHRVFEEPAKVFIENTDSFEMAKKISIRRFNTTCFEYGIPFKTRRRS